VEVDAVTAVQLGLPRGSLLHVDRRRAPARGDLVLAELVVGQRLTRTLRRLTQVEGVVTLAPIGGGSGSLIRSRYEIDVVGVVDGFVATPGPRSARVAQEVRS
jgi:hypothetical protein